ncbi:Pyridoxal phosphate phosphatase YbhA [invertebrate metagenome]|uniref:Pyridoxal phosphate phosphatase YbhA n=1 Tax=invertebrate metagenome TaxID=1711999 RepID=A0A2H9T796_9ZZZZ
MHQFNRCQQNSYKVLALDLDGTTLMNNQSIHPAVKQAIQEAQQSCHVVLVTGRHHTTAVPYHRQLGLTTPIICCNGTYVYDDQNHQVLAHNAIKKEDALSFIELTKKFQIKTVTYITDAMTYAQYNPVTYVQKLEAWANTVPESYRPNIYQVDSFSHQVRHTDFVWKFVIEGEPDVLAQLMDNPWVSQTFSSEYSWSNRIDIAAKGNSKGKRLSEYVATLGYLPEQVMAAGDNHNDISMLRYAGLSIVMANADDTIQSFADEICPTDNNHDGLAQLIHKHLLQKLN